MNYLCHARDCLERPYELVGTVLPDWVRMLDRRACLRPWMVGAGKQDAEATSRDPGPREGIERGLRRHFADDAWFHTSPVFGEVSRELAARIREVHPDRPGRRLRASFFAHLLLEMLLDAHLLERRPGMARTFARAVRSVDPEAVIRVTCAIAPRPVEGLSGMLYRFGDPGVLRSYADDTVVTQRLNRMGRIVAQPPLPLSFEELVGPARVLVRRYGDALLARPPDRANW